MKFRTKSARDILRFRPVNRDYRFFVIWPHPWSVALFKWSRDLGLHKVHKMKDWHLQNRIVMHMEFLMQLKACTVRPSVSDHAINQQPGHQRPTSNKGIEKKRKKTIQVQKSNVVGQKKTPFLVLARKGGYKKFWKLKEMGSIFSSK